MKNNDIERLIARQLAGEATKKEADDLRLWLNSSPQNNEEYNKVALTYQLSKSHINSQRKSIVLNRLSSRIDAERKKGVSNFSSYKITRIKWAVAASIVLFVSVGLMFYTQIIEENPVDVGVSLIEKTNPAGQKSKIFLPDGSIVWLNSESSLSYTNEYNDSIRFVEMEGEAYFEVKKDASRPFIVKSKTLTIIALGTAFNINTFNKDNEVLVALTEGKISVDNMDSDLSSLIIYPGEGVLYKPLESEEMQKISIDIEGVKSWRDGVLSLKNATLQETIDQLSRWYGVQFILTNEPIRIWSATGVFDNEYLENVLNTLSFSQDFDYEIDGKNINITFSKKTMPMVRDTE